MEGERMEGREEERMEDEGLNGVIKEQERN